MFITIISPKEDSSDVSGFLRGSLFDNTKVSSLEIPELIFNTEEFLKVHNEALALRRYGALFLDYLYTMEIEPERNSENDGESQVEGVEVVGEIRLVKELSFKRMIVGPTHLQLSSSMMHRMELVLKLSFEDIIPRKGQYIYAVCWLVCIVKYGDRGLEKAAFSSLRSQTFTILTTLELANSLLFFPLSPKINFVIVELFRRNLVHATVTFGRDRKNVIQTLLRTNQTAGFVTLLSWKKKLSNR